MLQYKKLINKLTLEEKASLCSGDTYWDTKAIKRLGIQSIFMADGPNGLRVQKGKTDELGINASEKATCFPSIATASNSWDKKLLYEMGEGIAKEALEEKVSILLAPGVNIKRNPLCGRNFEYLSEDPYLTGTLATEYVKGVQSLGVGVSVKHFAVNNQETRRKVIDAIVDERTLREIYLYAFEMVVKEANPLTVMSAYNKLNGTYCTENRYLLGILKNEWKHKGIVITDWNAENDRIEGIKAGNELEMPTTDGKSTEKLIKAVESGKLSERILNKRVDRILAVIFKCVSNLKEEYKFDHEENNKLAQKIAEKSIILLKNEDNILPINKEDKVLLVGDMAKYPRFQGAGSATTMPEKIYNTLDSFKNMKIKFDYLQGYERIPSKKDNKLLKQVCKKAKDAKVIVIYAGLTENYETEGMDRKNLQIPLNQVKLIEEVSKINKNIIVVLAGGSVIEMPWIDKVKGIIHSYLSGQAGAKAIADILVGNVNPSGKLAETYPLKLQDVPSYKYFPGDEISSQYREGIYVGYRYYEKAKKEILFPFGFGLSYTEYQYSDLEVNKNKIDFDNDDKIEIKFKIKNIGKVAGEEIAQVYISQENPHIFKPEKELKGFEKVSLNPGQQKEVSMILDKRAFSYYNVEKKDWTVEAGKYNIIVGKSSRNIVLSKKITINSTDENITKKYPQVYYNADVQNVTTEEFEELLGKKVPSTGTKIKHFTLNNTIEQSKHTLIGGIIYNYSMKFKLKRYLRKQDISKASKVIMNMQNPIRHFARRKNSKYNDDMLEGFVKMLNGKYIEGMRQINKGKSKLKELEKNKRVLRLKSGENQRKKE